VGASRGGFDPFVIEGSGRKGSLTDVESLRAMVHDDDREWTDRCFETELTSSRPSDNPHFSTGDLNLDAVPYSRSDGNAGSLPRASTSVRFAGDSHLRRSPRRDLSDHHTPRCPFPYLRASQLRLQPEPR
jgi:hypothetical protein